MAGSLRDLGTGEGISTWIVAGGIAENWNPPNRAANAFSESDPRQPLGEPPKRVRRVALAEQSAFSSRGGSPSPVDFLFGHLSIPSGIDRGHCLENWTLGQNSGIWLLAELAHTPALGWFRINEAREPPP